MDPMNIDQKIKNLFDFRKIPDLIEWGSNGDFGPQNGSTENTGVENKLESNILLQALENLQKGYILFR